MFLSIDPPIIAVVDRRAAIKASKRNQAGGDWRGARCFSSTLLANNLAASINAQIYTSNIVSSVAYTCTQRPPSVAPMAIGYYYCCHEYTRTRPVAEAHVKPDALSLSLSCPISFNHFARLTLWSQNLTGAHRRELNLTTISRPAASFSYT